MSLREKLLRVAPEEWENEFVRIRPMTTRDDLIYAGDGCRLTDEQREFVNPVWFSLGRAYLRNAQSLEPLLTNAFIIKSPHPSPLSASRGFFGSKPFSRANQALVTMGADPVDWTL